MPITKNINGSALYHYKDRVIKQKISGKLSPGVKDNTPLTRKQRRKFKKHMMEKYGVEVVYD